MVKTKMKRKSWRGIVITVVVVVLVLFVLYNVGTFLKMHEMRGESLSACENLVEGERCEFLFNRGFVDGLCVEGRRGELVCRPAGVFRD